MDLIARGHRVSLLMISTLVIVCGIHAQDFTVFSSPTDTPREQLKRYLNGIARQHLRERAREVAGLRTREHAESRKKLVREKILRLIGGLPDHRGPLNTRQVGVLERGDYRVEKIIYESLPSFYVPANVYVPQMGNGPFPAILMPVGHGPDGKGAERETAVGLVRKGFIVLKYDPLGQGERLQYYDPDLRRSKVVVEHDIAGAHTLLIGENLARYRIWDGMRGIDYLLTRNDVDPSRIGCTGCSGGGTLTTYISALDHRIRAAAPACYITSWQELMEKLGPQDSEQSFPNFLKEGLDMADFVELFAPKPLLIASTIGDFFPLEGARQTYEEAKRFYEIYGASDHLFWYIGPGLHGVPQPSREAIYAFFIRYLKNGLGNPREAPIRLDALEQIQCTPTGQVADSLGGETVFTLNRKRSADLIPTRQPVSNADDVKQLRARLVREMRTLASINRSPNGNPPPITVHSVLERDGYGLEVISLRSESGVRFPGLLLTPHSEGRKSAVLAVDSRPKQSLIAPGGDLDYLAKSGHVVLLVQPRGTQETPAPPSRGLGPSFRNLFLGDYLEVFRAYVVGKTFVGMRTEDIFQAADYLTSRPDVDADRITGYAHGVSGVPLLHAAVIDSRIRRVVLEESLAAYRMGVERPIHTNLFEVAIPGVLLKYDLADLVLALSPREITIVNPVDTLGVRLRLQEYRDAIKYVLEADRLLGTPDRVCVISREPADALWWLLGCEGGRTAKADSSETTHALAACGGIQSDSFPTRAARSNQSVTEPRP